MDELELLKASIKKQWGEIPAEIDTELAALEEKLKPVEVVAEPDAIVE